VGEGGGGEVPRLGVAVCAFGVPLLKAASDLGNKKAFSAFMITVGVARYGAGHHRILPPAWNQPSITLCVCSESATALSARCKSSGNFFPRFSARRRMPRQAFGLKKYRCGTGPASKISDNEHTPSSLGNRSGMAVHSHKLSVKHSPCVPIPEFAQAPEKGSKIPSSVRRQDAGDVLPYQPAGAISFSNGKIGEHEASSRVSQAFAKPRDRERLAWGSSDENIDSCIGPLLESGHVTPVGRVGIVVGKNGRGERFDL
jgi:hypothetical protein